ncbi:alcohol dehydrogenase catalytic domain-containing protein [Pseudomonas pergaminensis]|jgi:uncharacterized zinc-type alcohol dehydrogenase-like protein
MDTTDKSDFTDQQKMSPQRRTFLKGAASLGAVGLSSGLLSTASASPQNSSQAAPAAFTQPFPAHGYAAKSADSPLAPFSFQRRAIGANDVVIDIRYCGVCHSDIHTSKGQWGEQRYPLVTGHEIAGVILAVGSGVSNYKVGDRVGVGCMVDSCGHCAECSTGFEQYCEVGPTMTYGSKVDTSVEPGGLTQGGYSSAVVVSKDFLIRVPDAIDLAAAGPLMCAAVTVYSPLRHWNIRKGYRVGIVGMGGLGHLAVKMATAMGTEVVVFTTSPDKVADAKRFGAVDVVVNNDPEKLKQYTRKLDFVLSTVPYQYDMDPVMATLKRDATMCLVGIGLVTQPNQLGPFTTIQKRNSFAGSMIGSIRETQDAVDFCNLHNIRPDYKLIGITQINSVWEQVVAKKARYRYVIDLKKA